MDYEFIRTVFVVVFCGYHYVGGKDYWYVIMLNFDGRINNLYCASTG